MDGIVTLGVEIRLKSKKRHLDALKREMQIRLIGTSIETIESALSDIESSRDLKSNMLTNIKGVLIDDDSFIPEIWNQLGKPFGNSLTYFASGNEFLAVEKEFPRDIPIFVDWFLLSDCDSTDLILSLKKLLFTDIYVISNDSALDLTHLDGIIKGAIAKERPWQLL